MPPARNRVAFNGIAFLISLIVGLIVDLALVVTTGMLLPRALALVMSPESATTWGGLARDLCGLPVMAAIGFLYAYLHSRGEPLNVASGLLGGALTGALTGLVSRLAQTCLTISTLAIQSVSGLELFSSELPVAAAGAGLLIVALINICIGVSAGAVLGLIGGAAGVLLFGRRAVG